MDQDSTWASVVNIADYYPFGLAMDGRTGQDSAYRYGFNGKEQDSNGEWGSKSHYDYGFRIYNPSIAKFLNVDPLTKSYPELTPYQFASNTPIQAIDLDGLEAATFQFEIRTIGGINAISVTSSFTVGLMAVKNSYGKISMSSFITPTVGGGAGLGISGGFSSSIYPTVTDTDQLSGLGLNIGAFAGTGLPMVQGSIEVNFALDLVGDENQVGGTFSSGMTGWSIGGGVFGELSYTYIHKTVTPEEFINAPLELFGSKFDLEKLGISNDQIKEIGQQLINQVNEKYDPVEIESGLPIDF